MAWALSLLDRFRAADVANINGERGERVAGAATATSRFRDEYQLAALTALFLAMQLFEKLQIRPDHLSYLSRSWYVTAEVVEMEVPVLVALRWRVYAADKANFADALLAATLPGLADEEDAAEDAAEDGDGAATPGRRPRPATPGHPSPRAPLRGSAGRCAQRLRLVPGPGVAGGPGGVPRERVDSTCARTVCCR